MNVTLAVAAGVLTPAMREHISPTVFAKLFFKSQFPYKSVNLSFMEVVVKDKLTDLCGH